MAREGTNPANIPEVTWPSILTQRHTVPNPGLANAFKRPSNETEAKQLLFPKPLCRAVVGESRGCPSQRGSLGTARTAQDALGWGRSVYSDP